MTPSFTAFLLLIVLLVVAAVPSGASAPPELVWREMRPADVGGRGWADGLAAPYDRLPARAEQTVPPAVWGLSRHSAGMRFRFRTDSPRIGVRWTLRGESLAMPHMPATGVSGVDLYARSGNGEWRFVAVGQPKTFPTNEMVVAAPAGGETREYLLYLPLYNGVTSVSLGLEPGHTLEVVPERRRGVVFYGTSITQGGCASRPGLAWTAIVGRRLDVPIVNLGFSGNGKMEAALADLVAELAPDVFVLDCLRNMSEDQVREGVEPFIRRLRKSRPDTPILLPQDAFIDSPADTPRGKLVRESVERLTREGVPGLYYVPMRYALGTDGEGTVDGVHPNDLGMMRQAEAVAAALRPLLLRGGGTAARR